jgi:hypothetical protein
VAGWTVARLARRVKVTVSGPSGVLVTQAGEITGLVGDLQDGPTVWLQPAPDLPVADRQSR